MEEGWEPLKIGRGELLKEGDDLLIVAYGAMVPPAMKTAMLLEESGIKSTVINARFLRPLDQALIHPLARRIGKIVTMEEGALGGGFGSAVIESLTDQDILLPVLRIGIPDQLVHHASPQQSKESLGLTPQTMCDSIKRRFGWEDETPTVKSKTEHQSMTS